MSETPSVSRRAIWYGLFVSAVVLSSSALAQSPACQPRTRIVGGLTAKLEHWPGIAAIRTASDAGEVANYICGGALIAESFVLTAAHCVAAVASPTDVAVTSRVDQTAPGRLEVVLGVADLTAVGPADIYPVVEVIAHETYRQAHALTQNLPPAEIDAAEGAVPATTGHDLALLRLARPHPGPFARLGLTEASIPAPGAQTRVAGFGRRDRAVRPSWSRTADGTSEFSAGSPRLMETALPLVATRACTRRYAGSAVGSGQVCAGFESGGTDSCQGDSGGPLVAFDAGGCPYQIGIVSWGEDCAKPATYGVYTRVAAYRAWIESHTGPLNGAGPAPPAAGLAQRQFEEGLAQLEAALGATRGRLSMRIRGGTTLALGRDVAFEASSSIAGRLVVIDVNANRELTLIFPNRFSRAHAIAAGAPITIPGADHGFQAFRASEPVGKSWLIALVTPMDFDIDAVAASSAIRTRGFAPVPEPTGYLMAFVRQIEKAMHRNGHAAEGWALAVVPYEITP